MNDGTIVGDESERERVVEIHWTVPVREDVGMEAVVIVIVGVLAIAAANTIAPKLRVAAPLVLVAVGVLVSYLPDIPPIDVNPELILMGILPPLLYASAVAMPTMEFKRDLFAVSGLSVLLVIVSALGLGFVFMLILPDVDFATGVALGAILSPTDAVATTTVKRVGAPNRLITVLSGESLFNDASALVLLRSAIAAMATTVSLWGVAGSFVWAIVGAVVVGAVVGIVVVRLRARISNPATATAISFVAPYLAYAPAELTGSSGLVAAVAAGLVAGRGSIKHLTAAHRLSDAENWRTIELLLEGAVFLLMGLQLKALVADVQDSHDTVWHAVWPAAIGFVLLIVIRALVVIPLVHWSERRSRRVIAREEQLAHLQESLIAAEHLDEDAARKVRARIDRRLADIAYYRTEAIGTREGFVVVWAGMRGAVTLAAAQTLPPDTAYRSMLILLAFIVAAGSLVIQGGTLGAFVRWLKLPDHSAQEAAERRDLSREMASIANTVVHDRTIYGDDPDVARRLAMLRQLEATQNDDAEVDPDAADIVAVDRRLANAETMRSIRRVILQRQREHLLDLGLRAAYSSEALTTALARLDAEELSLDAQRSIDGAPGHH